MTELADDLDRWWSRHGGKLLWLAVAYMVLAGADRLGAQLWRLVADPGPDGAIDLRSQWDTVQRLFAGGRVYAVDQLTDNHPPASYVLLWPLLGWLSLDAARSLWAASTVAFLPVLGASAAYLSRLRQPVSRLFMLLTAVTMYATAITAGNGQLAIHVMVCLFASFLVLSRASGTLGTDLLAAVLFVIALVKPTITAAFFWAFLVVPGRLRPAVLACSGYALLSAVAAGFQEAGTIELMRAWLERGVASAGRGAAGGGYMNVQSWLAAVGAERWSGVAALAMLAALAAWSAARRRSDVWLLVGVAAIVARMFVYHRIYDDLLLLFPMVALARLAADETAPASRRVSAGAVLAVAWLAAQAPARLHSAPAPLNALFDGGQALVWLLVLVYLLAIAPRTSRQIIRNG